jgi:tetratricopeptide (TPR) repeat protein
MRHIFRDPSKTLTVLLPVLLIASAPFLRAWVQAQKATVSQDISESIEARNENAFALILGELRATAADLMFIKTERYFHSGVAYKPHMDMDKMATTGERAAKEPEDHEHHSDEDHEHEPHMELPDGEELAPHHHDEHCDHGGTHAGGIPTLIRTAAQDFRGFLGDLERETKPYRDPKLEHHVTSGEELLPWYRLMTLSDPHNLRGYMIGTMLLLQAKKSDEALSFIQEGIEKNRGNPRAFRLYASLAQVRWRSGHLDMALAAARRGYKMGKAVRPRGGKIGATRKDVLWTDDLENDFLFLARYVPLFLERKGDLLESFRAAQEAASLAPDDPGIRQMLQRFQDELSEQSPRAD